MIKNLSKILKLVGRWFWLTSALLIIGTVILVVLGRQTIGSVDQMRPTLQALIKDSTGMQVRLGELQGEWPRLVPILDIEKIEILTEDQSTAIAIDHSRADLDFFNSIKFGTAIWRELVADRLELNLEEDSEGSWRIKGFEGSSGTDLNIILDPLFYSRLIRIKLVVINLQFYSGKQMQIHSDQVQLENDVDFHRAELSTRLPDQDVPAYLLLEGEGDPSDLESFHASGYLELAEFNVSLPLIELTKALMPQMFANLENFQANASGAVWFDIHPGGAIDFEGDVEISEVPLDWLVEVPPLQNIQAELTGWFTPRMDWGVRLQGFDFEWSDAEVDPLDLVFSQRLGSNWRDFDVTVNHLDLTVLTDLLRQTRLPAEQILTTIDKLRPQGNLEALTVGQNQAGYYASANLDAVDVNSYKGAPAIKGISGYLELQQGGGLFHIADTDGFDVLFPNVYKDYLRVEKSQGTVYVDWQPETKKLVVRSDAVMTKVDAGTSRIMFSVEQQLPSNGQPPELNLIIGGRDIDAVKSKKFLSYKLQPDLKQWLDTAIVASNVKEFGLVLRSGPPLKNKTAKTTQLLFSTENTDLDYHPDWPGMRGMDTLVLVDDGYVESSISQGSVGGAKIIQAQATYDADLPPAQRLLVVDGQLSGGLADSINILAQSPVKTNIGPLSGWEFAGHSDTQMHLEIPLGRKPGAVPVPGKYKIAATLEQATIAIPQLPIALTNMAGKVEYSNDTGLESEDISGQFWGRPLTASLYQAEAEQKIALKTEIAPDSLNQLIEFPWTQLLIGDIAIEGLVSIPASVNGVNAKPVALQLSSQLAGTEVRLPAPLALAAKDTRNADLTFYFSPELNQLEGHYGDKLISDLRFDAGALRGGVISYDRTVEPVAADKLLVAAYLPTTSWPVWQPLISMFTTGLKADMPRLWQPVFDLKFDQLELATFELADIGAQISFADQGTEVTFTSNLADGFARLGDAEQQVPEVRLSRLSLPSLLLEQKIDQQDMDPREFLAMNLWVDQLSVADIEWGSIAFELRPEVSGAAFNNIRGNLFGLRPGIYEDEPPTEFFWRFDGNNYSSRLVGPVGVSNIGDVFSRFDIAKVADSESGKLAFDLSWQDKPWNISRENITGDFEIQLQDGSFYRSAGSAGGALKLVSLLNFANWLRRLQLDFSDVVGQNLAYNDLAGKLHFETGVASLRDPLKMNMPSGRMSMAGDFGLLDETVDAQLVATLPVATNLPWVVALMGGLPAAAGVYLTSKLVEKQVDRLSSISYEVTGSWDDVTVSVDKIFAEELKAKPAQESTSSDSKSEKPQ